MSGREVCDVLIQNGFVAVRQRGSHIVMQRRDGSDTITVVVPDHPELKIDTLSATIRQSKLARNLFEC